MRSLYYLILIFYGTVCFFSCHSADKRINNVRPNILFIIADDASRKSMGIYGSDYIQTPFFDQLAREGVLFTNAVSNNPKCSPARASILTGRHSWQLEEAVVHRPLMPEKWVFYPELLEAEGYFVGYTGKGWGPGLWRRGKFNPAGKCFDSLKLKPPYTGISEKDYGGNFASFLDQKPDGKPFCFWIGTHEPHRDYEKDSHLKGGKNLKSVKVQEFFPDNDVIKGDLLDYALEVEWFDKQIGKAMTLLKERGELENTIIIVTSDHGMPFPRVKGQIYNEGFEIPLAIRWGKVIKPGRVVNDFINLADFAPTIMKSVGLQPHPQMTGVSFLDIIESKKSGWIDSSRNFAIIGKERHDIGRNEGDKIAVGYPVRAIKTKNYLYIKNYNPQRWPAGNPEHGYRNSDDGPTEDYLVSVSKDTMHPEYKYFQLCLSFRDSEELYDVEKDPDCIDNLAFKVDFSEVKERLKQQMISELKFQKDPRVLGNGDIFDSYYYMGFEAMKDEYGNRFSIPEDLKKYRFISNGRVE